MTLLGNKAALIALQKCRKTSQYDQNNTLSDRYITVIDHKGLIRLRTAEFQNYLLNVVQLLPLTHRRKNFQVWLNHVSRLLTVNENRFSISNSCNHQKKREKKIIFLPAFFLPVRRNSALVFKRFRIEDSARRGKTRFISSIRIRLGRSWLNENNR